jgi:S1-C subfamily serine protease
MNILKLFLVALPLSAASTPALAQSPEAQQRAEMEALEHEAEAMEREAEAREREVEARELEYAEALREAEARLEEAAARVAELSTRNLPEMMLVEKRMKSMKGRPRIGITIAPSDEGDGPVEGVRIIGVTPGSAATDAGLRSGDVITSVNGESMSGDTPMAANKRLLGLVKGVEEGDKLEIEYLREGNVGKCTVEPRVIDEKMFVFRGPGAEDLQMEIPVAPGAPAAPLSLVFGGVRGWADLELVELNDGLGKYFGTKDGLLVVKAPNSGALELEDGDVIQSIDGREPQSVGHAIRILSSYQPGEELELAIMRDKESRTLKVEVPDDRTSFRAPLPPHPLAPEPPALPVPDVAPVLDGVPLPAVPVLAPTPAMATPVMVRETRT